MATSVDALPIDDQLAQAFRGVLVGPDDAEFDDARMVWNGMFDRRPALIARCSGAADVIAAVNFARENELTGRRARRRPLGQPATATCDDGLVIDLVADEEDPTSTRRARTVRAEAGLTWGEFDRATQEHGLAVTGGRFSTTGIAGLDARQRQRLARAQVRPDRATT